jgi:poly-gamma-glutamate synthesis protein (capsule biosynthesis protein)
MRFVLRFPLHRAVLVAGALAIGPATQAAEGDQVTIVLTGDTGLNRGGQPVEADGVRRGGFQTWADTTSLIADDINGDLNFTNIETVVTDRNDLTPDTKGQGGPFNFRTHPNGLRHLVMRGFNVLSLANNHSMDYGVEGLKETLKHVGALKAERRAVAAGVGMNREEASRPVRVNVRGSEIAFAAIGIVTNNLERHRAGPDKPGQIAYRFKEDFAEVLKRLAATPAQYRILSIHYGVEGLKDTLKHTEALHKERRAVAAGLGMNREQAGRPRRVTVKGSEIAFAATGIVTNNLERHRAGPNKPGQIAYRFDDDFAEVRKRLVDTPAQYRILSIHYGEEGRVRADAKQLADFRGLAAQRDGIDLIVGHHAHVVRGVELAGRSLIFYGLGNFLHHGTADMTGKGVCRDYGLMARVHLKEGKGGKLSLRAVEAIPVTDTHFRPRRMTGVAGATRIHALNYLASTLDDDQSGARGLRFTPQEDGSGLYCVAEAKNDGGRIGSLCKSYSPAPAIPNDMIGAIGASCAR